MRRSISAAHRHEVTLYSSGLTFNQPNEKKLSHQTFYVTLCNKALGSFGVISQEKL